jgi:Malectin domain
VGGRSVSGGVLVQRKASIQDPSLKILFIGERYGHFTYRLPVPPGEYRLKLFFAETYFGSKLN